MGNMRWAKVTLSVILTIAMFAGAIPAGLPGRVAAFAEQALAASESKAPDVDGASEFTEDIWLYALDGDGYAVVTGCLDTEKVQLEVPSVLGGAQVTGIASGAFASLAALEEITIPAAVSAIGEDIFAGGQPVCVRSLSGSAALAYAAANGLPAVNMSGADLVQGVVDMSDLGADQYTYADGLLTLVPPMDGRCAEGDIVYVGDYGLRITGMSGSSFIVEELLPPEFMNRIVFHKNEMPVEDMLPSGEFTTTSEEGVTVTANSICAKGSKGFEVAVNWGDISFTVPVKVEGTVGLDLDYSFREGTLYECNFSSKLKVEGSFEVEADITGEDGVRIPVGRVLFYVNPVVTVGAKAELVFRLKIDGSISYCLELNGSATYDPATGEFKTDAGYDATTEIAATITGSGGYIVTPYVFIPGLGNILEIDFNMDLVFTVQQIIHDNENSEDGKSRYNCMNFDLDLLSGLELRLRLPFGIKWDLKVKADPIKLFKRHIECDSKGNWYTVEICSREAEPPEEELYEPEEEYVTITFDPMNGEYIEPQVILRFGTAACPADPVREGYVFLGWFRDPYSYTSGPVFTYPWTEDYTFYEDEIIYAAWREITDEPSEEPIVPAPDAGTVFTGAITSGGVYIDGVYDCGSTLAMPSVGDYVLVREYDETIEEYVTTSMKVLGYDRGFCYEGWYDHVIIPADVAASLYYAGMSWDSVYDSVTVVGDVDGSNLSYGLYIPDSDYLILDGKSNNLRVTYAAGFSPRIVRFKDEATDVSVDNCDLLEAIYFEKAVKRGGEEDYIETTFYNNPRLTAIHFEGGADLSDASIYDCPMLSEVTFGEAPVLGDWLFQGLPGLETISIPDGSALGKGVFASCVGLKSVTLPSDLKEISYSLFDGCVSLETVNIPSGVTFIDKYAFKDCRSLKLSGLPAGLTEIDASAFSECVSIDQIDLPSSLKKIGGSAFHGIDGVTEIVIPSGVTEIGAGAFAYMENLKSVTLPEDLETIPDDLFTNCEKLEKIDIPENVTSIGDYAFDECVSLTEIELPDSVESIGFEAFSGCTGLAEIDFGDGVENIDGHAFRGCTALTEVVIPEGLVSIGSAAFAECSALETISLPEGLESIGVYAFEHCEALKELVIPEGVTQLQDPLYGNYPVLERLVIPGSVEEIPGYLMYDVGYFNGEIVIGDGVKSIGAYSISPNEYSDAVLIIRDITLPDSIGYVGDGCFSGLEYLGTVDLGNGNPSFGYGAFCDCPALSQVNIGKNIKSLNYVFRNCDNLTRVVIPENVSEMMNSFYNCDTLSSVTILSKDIVMYGCFTGCSPNLVIRGFAGTPVEEYCKKYAIEFEPLMGSQVTVRWTADGSNFSSKLVTSGKLLTGISNPMMVGHAFTGWYQDAACTQPWTMATDLVPAEGLTLYAGWMEISEDEFAFRKDGDHMVVIDCLTEKTELVLPSVVNGLPVTHIASGCFSGSPVVKLSIHSKVNDIAPGAFTGAANLTSVTFASGSPFTFENGCIMADDGKKLVYSLRALRSAEMEISNDVTTIADMALYGTSALEQVRMPDSLKSIGVNVFSGSDIMLFGSTENEIAEDYAAANDMLYNHYPVTYMYGEEIWYETTGQAGKELSVIQPPVEDGLAFAWYTDEEAKYPWSEGSTMPEYALVLYAGSEPMFDTAAGNADGVTITGYNGPAGIVTVPGEISGKTVTGIAANAFTSGAEEKVTRVFIPASVTSIEKGAFAEDTVLIADAGTAAADYAAAYGNTFNVRTYRITFLTRGGSAVESMEYALGTALTLPETEKYGYDFSGWFCDAAFTVAAPDAMPGYDLRLYAAWTVSENVSDFSVVVLPGGGVRITGYTGDDIDVEIPEKLGGARVLEVSRLAFKDNTTLRSVSFPDSVTSLEKDNFSGCTSLEVVKLGNGITEFNEGHIAKCPKLEAVILGDNLTKLVDKYSVNYAMFAEAGSKTMRGFPGLNSLVDGKAAIVEMLDSDGLSYGGVGEKFYGHAKLYWPVMDEYEVTWSAPEGAGTISDQGVFVPEKLGIHEITATIEGSDFTCTVNPYAIYDDIQYQMLGDGRGLEVIGCRYYGEEDIIIPEQVEGIDVVSIGYSAFEYLDTYAIVLPSTVKEIYSEAFYCCDNLTLIVIPGDVEYIDEYYDVIVGCYNATIACVYGGEVYKYAVKNEIPYILLTSDSEDFTVVDNDTGYTIVGYSGSASRVLIPDEIDGIPVTAIGAGENVFTGNGVTEVVIPDSITSIGANAFKDSTALSEINIPDSVTFVGENAFAGCALERVILCSGITSVGAGAFDSDVLVYCQTGSATAQALTAAGIDWTAVLTRMTLNTGKLVLNMFYSETGTITPTFVPEDTPMSSVRWYSMDESVAVVDGGVVTPVGVGSTYVFCEALDGSGISRSCNVVVTNYEKISVTGITLDVSEAYMTPGNTLTINAAVTPADAADTSVVWSVSDETLASVKNGVVTALATGEVKVTCVAADGSGVSASCNITIADEPDAVPVSSVTLDMTELSLATGAAITLKATVLPISASNKNLLWTSADETVAIVNDGCVQAVAPGTTVITCKALGGENVAATCAVTVTAPVLVTGIALDSSEIELVVGESTEIAAMVSPSDATNKTLSWNSSDTSVAKVVNGIVTAVGVGQAEITCAATDGSGVKSICFVHVQEPAAEIVPVTEIALSGTKLSLTEGETASLTFTVTPENATNKKVIWASSNTSVATVSGGVVKAVSAGSATITCTAADGSGVKAECVVTVTSPASEKIPVTGITLSAASATLNAAKGESMTLTATVAPANATNKKVTWASSNTSVATVSGGVVKAVSAGSATITCTAADGSGVKASCAVTVVNIVPVTGITLSAASATLNAAKGESMTLTATVAPANATNKKVTWASSNTSVATVNGGVVKAVSAGSATITCTAADGSGVKASCAVTVVNKPDITLKLNLEKITIGVSQSVTTLKVTTEPANLAVTWSSANEKIATVDANGKIKGVKKGETTIVVTVRSGDTVVTEECSIKVVKKGMGVTKIKLNQKKANLTVGKSLKLKATLTPKKVADKKVIWESSDTSVVTVSASGKVKAVGIGSATITATASSGKTAKCVITVTGAKIKKITLTGKKKMKVGDIQQLLAKIKPENAANKTLKWKSSNKKIATVDENGVVTAIKKGTVTITATSKDGSKVKATFKITIKK